MAGQEAIVVCDIGPQEYDELLALWQRAGLSARPSGRDSREAFARQMARGSQRALGLRNASGALVAAAVLTHDGRKGWINRLAVDPAYRRQGLARLLIRQAERWFREDLGLEIYAALIARDNAASRALFGRSGYEELNVVYVTRRERPEA